MASIDVFKQDAFSTTSLVAAVEKVPFQPGFIGSLGIFEDMPIRTKDFWVEERAGTLSLIQTSERGAPLGQRTTEKRTARGFTTRRIAKHDRLMADELLAIRAFGSESEVMAVQQEIARRLSGPTGLQAEVEYTWENMRLGAVQGIVLDADGSTVYNWFTEFGVSQPTEVAMDIVNVAAGALRNKIAQTIVRPMLRAAQGVVLPSTRIVAMCSDAFFDDLIGHADVRTTYLNWAAATELRKGTAFEAFNFGGVDWYNYRGSDDNSTIAVAADKAKFFLQGAPGLFKQVWAPAEFLEFVGTPGKPIYPMTIPDKDRQAYVDIEVYSYPMFVCTRPLTLYRAKRGA